jgi:membrane protease subunit HflC
VIDVRIKRADLPDGTPLDSAFTRMATARAQEAATIRAQGKRTRRSSVPKRPLPARRPMPRAFGKDPDFYDFYRAMQSYDYTFTQKTAIPASFSRPTTAI